MLPASTLAGLFLSTNPQLPLRLQLVHIIRADIRIVKVPSTVRGKPGTSCILPTSHLPQMTISGDGDAATVTGIIPEPLSTAPRFNFVEIGHSLFHFLQRSNFKCQFFKTKTKPMTVHHGKSEKVGTSLSNTYLSIKYRYLRH